MRSMFLAVPTLLLAGLLAQPAGAITLDFAAIAEAGGDQTALSFSFNDVGGSGVDVVATARKLSDGTAPFNDPALYVFLDEFFHGNPGGLGVCKTNDCEASDDDNISRREVAILTFSEPVEITEILFSNGLHVDVYSGKIGVNIGDTNPTTAEAFSHIFAASAAIHPDWVGSRFSFVANESFVGAAQGDLSRIYIQSIAFEPQLPPVPEPSALLLLGLGAAGLALRARTR